MTDQLPEVKGVTMQKYGFSMTDKGTTATSTPVGAFYLVSDVEEMVARLLASKNQRIAELEAELGVWRKCHSAPKTPVPTIEPRYCDCTSFCMRVSRNIDLRLCKVARAGVGA